MQGEFILENAWGFDNKFYFVTFPGIRILFSGGHFAVAIFFVISGYVLASSPLRAVHKGETGPLAENLGSALFRRWLRLFIPVAATTFIWMTCWHVFGIRSGNPIADMPEKSWRDEVWKWYCDFKNYSFIFTGDSAWNHYNDHAWSLPAEFRGSIVVYTSLLAFARFGMRKRLICNAILIWYFLYIVDGWYCALFVVGMILCDLDMLAEKKQLTGTLKRAHNLPTWTYYILFLASLYLGGVPSISNDIQHLRRSPGWYFLSFLKPQAVYDFRWFFRVVAATLAMISIPKIAWLRAFFESRFCRYLGRVSFAFYLVHGPVLWTLGDRIYAASGRVREGHVGIVPGWINLCPYPSWGPFGLELNYLLPHLILLPFTLLLAELVTTLIDEPSTKLARWLFGYEVQPRKEKSEKWAL